MVARRNQVQRDLEESLRRAREAKFGHQRTDSKSGPKTIKSNAEKEQEGKDRESVEKTMNDQTYKRALQIFVKDANKGESKQQNPWHPRIGQTMFWM